MSWDTSTSQIENRRDPLTLCNHKNEIFRAFICEVSKDFFPNYIQPVILQF